MLYSKVFNQTGEKEAASFFFFSYKSCFPTAPKGCWSACKKLLTTKGTLTALTALVFSSHISESLSAVQITKTRFVPPLPQQNKPKM